MFMSVTVEEQSTFGYRACPRYCMARPGLRVGRMVGCHAPNLVDSRTKVPLAYILGKARPLSRSVVLVQHSDLYLLYQIVTLEHAILAVG